MQLWLSIVLNTLRSSMRIRQARDSGQGLVEYALILLMVVIVCIVVVTLIGQNVSDAWYTQIVNAFD